MANTTPKTEEQLQALDKGITETSANIVRLGKLTEKLGQKNVQELEDLSDIAKSAKDLNGSSAKDLSKDIENLFQKTSKGTMKDRSIAKQQLKAFREISKDISNDNDKLIISDQLSKVDSLIASDRKITSTLSGSFSKMLPGLAGVVGALGAGSPLVGLIAAKGADTIKDMMTASKERKEANIQHAHKMHEEEKLLKEKLQAEKEKPEKEDLEEPLAGKDDFDNSLDDAAANLNSSAEKLTTAAASLSGTDNESAEKLSSAADNLSDNDNKSAETAEKIHEDSQETLIEQRQIDKENIAASREAETLTMPEFEENSSGFSFPNLFNKVKTGIFGMFSGLGLYFTKFIKFLPKILKKIPIIGPIISGGMGIFDKISELGPDAGIGDKLYAVITGAADGILDFFLGIPVMIIDFITGSDIGGFVESEGGYTELIAKSITSIISSVSTWVSELWSTVSNYVSNNLRHLAESILGSSVANYMLGDPSDEYKEFKQSKNNPKKTAIPAGADEFSSEEDYRKELAAIKKKKGRKTTEERSKSDNADIKPDLLKKTQRAAVIADNPTITNNVVNISNVSAPVTTNSITNKTSSVSRSSSRNSLKTKHVKSDN